MPVHYDKNGKIAVIAIEGRGDYNVWSPDWVYNALHDTLIEFRDDPSVWVAIIKAVEGKKAFTYGGDIEALDALVHGEDSRTRGYGAGGTARAWGASHESPVSRLFTDEMKIMKPIIFAIEGDCIGAGTLLMMALADIAVVSEKSRFGMVEIKPAIGPRVSWGEALMTRQLPWRIAMELLLTGRMMEADEALKYGFVNRAVPSEEVLPVANAYAEEIAANPPLHVQASKILAKACREIPYSAGFLQGDLMGSLLQTFPDSKEGPRAFLEHRKPVYTGNSR